MWVIARTARNRPSLMHLVDIIQTRTACGVNITGWSRAYFPKPIPQVQCLRCKKIGA